MPLYQNSTVDSNKLVVGNYTIYVGTITTAINTYATIASVGSALTNLGAGIINSFGHNAERYEVQAGNAPDPLEGIASETFTISGELIEYDGTKLAAAMGGFVTSSASSSATVSVLTGGGVSVLTPKTFVIANKRLTASASIETIIYVYKGYFTQGVQFTAKSDNDSDPINTMAFEIQGEIDGTRTAGDQLFSIRRTIVT